MRGRGDPEDLAAAAARLGVTDERVLEAVRSLPRERFVPEGSERQAYRDRPVPIPHGQTTSQPSLIAAMVAALEPQPSHRVLEIGTGYGYQTALLARLVEHVWTIERHAELTSHARDNLAAAAIDNVTLTTGDGTRGWDEHAPYDGIIVSAAFPRVPEPLAAQLADGGRLVMPLGPGGAEDVAVLVKRAEELARVGSLTPARFVRLYGAHGYPD